MIGTVFGGMMGMQPQDQPERKEQKSDGMGLMSMQQAPHGMFGSQRHGARPMQGPMSSFAPEEPLFKQRYA